MLKTTLLTQNLKEGITFTFHAVSSRSPLPILSNFLIESGRGSLVVSATDLEIGIKTTIPAKIESEGRVVVPAKIFLDLVNSIEEEKIELEEQEGKLSLKSTGIKSSFSTQSPDDFPVLFEEKGEKKAEFDKNVFEKTLSRVVFAAAQDTTRPALSGILIKTDAKEINVVATDGYRLSLKKEKKLIKEKQADLDLLISARVLKEVLSLGRSADSVTLYSNEKGNQTVFELGENLVVGRLIEAEYPDYQKIIPQDFSTSARFDRIQALNAVKSCSVFAREAANIIKIQILKNEVVFKAAASSTGENEVRVGAKIEGEENEIAFNSRYLIDFLSNIDENEITLEINGPLNPGVFKAVGDEGFLHLIMPIRIQE